MRAVVYADLEDKDRYLVCQNVVNCFSRTTEPDIEVRFPSGHICADRCASVTLSDNLNVLSGGDTIARSIPFQPRL